MYKWNFGELFISIDVCSLFNFYKFQILRFGFMNFYAFKKDFSSFWTITQKHFHQLLWNFGELFISIDVRSLLICINFRFYIFGVMQSYFKKKWGFFPVFRINQKCFQQFMMKLWWLVYIYWTKFPFVMPHYVFLVCGSVHCPSARPSCSRFKFLVEGKVFGQGSFWWSWSPINLKLSTHVPHDMIFRIF